MSHCPQLRRRAGLLAAPLQGRNARLEGQKTDLTTSGGRQGRSITGLTGPGPLPGPGTQLPLWDPGQAPAQGHRAESH